MKLTDKEIGILSILEDADLESIILFAEKKWIMSEKEVLEILARLIDLNLAEKVAIPEEDGLGNFELFFRTKNVSQDMLNDSLMYEAENSAKFGEKVKKSFQSAVKKVSKRQK